MSESLSIITGMINQHVLENMGGGVAQREVVGESEGKQGLVFKMVQLFLSSKNKTQKLGMVARTFNPRTWETKAGGSLWIPCEPGL